MHEFVNWASSISIKGEKGKKANSKPKCKPLFSQGFTAHQLTNLPARCCTSGHSLPLLTCSAILLYNNSSLPTVSLVTSISMRLSGIQKEKLSSLLRVGSGCCGNRQVLISLCLLCPQEILQNIAKTCP